MPETGEIEGGKRAFHFSLRRFRFADQQVGALGSEKAHVFYSLGERVTIARGMVAFRCSGGQRLVPASRNYIAFVGLS